jgi:hypothetical protein
MISRTFITEKALLYRLECPIRAVGSSITELESPLLLSAERTTSWLIAEFSATRSPTANQTRDAFNHYWEQTVCFQSRDTIAIKEYEKHIEKHVHVCWRLRELIWKREILQPVSRYELPIGDIAITGEYAVLRSARPKTNAQILYLREGGVTIRPVIPDVISFARIVDLGKRWLDSTNSWGIDSFSVLHYWVSRNIAAEQKPDQRFAANVLLGAAGVVTGQPFSILGDHCVSCPTQACRRDCWAD